jgi:outer membrane protein/adhesin transport system outer membrane protein
MALVVFLSQPAFADTLTEAMVKAYNTNPDLAAAQAELRATDELAPQALSGYRPNVSATATAGITSQESQSIGNHDWNSYSAGLQVQQPVYRGGRTAAAVREADSSIAAQRASLRNTEQNILLQATTAYLAVLRDEAVLALTKNNEQVLRRQLQAAQDRFSVGEVTITDVSQSEARLSGATAAKVQSEGTLTDSRATYQRIVGEAPKELKKPENTKLDLPITLDEALEAAAQNNPALIAAAHSRDAADAALDGVKGERLPTLTAQGSLSRSYDAGSPFADREDTASALLNINIPLYQAGAVSSRIREARQTVARRERERDSAERQATELVTSAWEQLKTAKATRESRASQVEAARVALDGVKQEAFVGSRSVLDTLDAEQEYLDAQVGLVRAEHDEMLAGYQILSAIGRLTARDLQLPVEYYDEKAYADQVRGQWIGSDVE